MDFIKRIFFWLAGAGTETLERCPNWEQRKYVAFGATVLVPCAFAFIACAYALSTLTDQACVIYPIAGVWATIILTIDRALLAGYRAYTSLSRKFSQFILRIVVALLMGVTIAHPLVLLLFRDTIHSVVEKQRSKEILEIQQQYLAKKQTNQQRSLHLETAISQQREKWNESFQAKLILQEPSTLTTPQLPGLTQAQQEQLQSVIKDQTEAFKTRLDTVNQQTAELTPQYTQLQTDLSHWQSEFERELNGERSGMKGEGPRARSIRADQLEPRRADAKRIATLLEHLNTEKTSLQSQIREAEANAINQFDQKLRESAAASQAEADRIAQLKQRVENDQASQFVSQQNALRDTIKQQIDTHLRELDLAHQELNQINSDEAKLVNAILTEPRRDVLTQTLALHQLFQAGSEGGQFAFYTYAVLTLLFMLIDTIPLIVKFFTKPGPYDTLVDRDEIHFDSEYQAYKTARKNYMQQLSETNLLALTRNPALENSLLSGLEQTRASQEFLTSLIELEKQFAEKLHAEATAPHPDTPSKREALQAMKQHFYENLHRRLEQFFSSNHH